MAWYLYDKNGFVEQIATYGGLNDMYDMRIQPLNDFFDNGGLETDVERLRVINAIKDVPEIYYLAEMLRDAIPPLIVTDGADSRINKFHADEVYTEYPPEDSIQSIDDVDRVYKKYIGHLPNTED